MSHAVHKYKCGVLELGRVFEMVTVKIRDSEIENLPVCSSNGHILNSIPLKTDLKEKIK